MIKTYWPRTLKELQAGVDAYTLDVSKPPYHASRYPSIEEAYRVGAETGETIVRDDLVTEKVHDS